MIRIKLIDESFTNMKTLFISVMCLITVVFSFSANAESASNACELTHAWAPVSPFLIDSGTKPTGYQVDLITMLGTEMECEIKYQKLRWNDSLEKLRTGEVDFVGRASKTPQREKWAYFSAPYSTELLVLYVKKGAGKNYNYATLKSLLDSKFKLGLVSGAYYGELNELIIENRYQQNIYRYSFAKDMIKALEQGEVDGIFEAPFIMDNYFANKNQTVAFEEYPLALITGQIYFMFSKNSVSKAFVDKFNSALETVKAKQEYKQHPYWPKNQ